MILKVSLGTGHRGLDSYVSEKDGAVLLLTNMGGSNARERAREHAGFRSARPALKKSVGHLILSHDPALPDLTPGEWRRAIDIARAEHDLRDAAFSAWLHVDSDHRHVHCFFTRIRPDGSVVSDSNSYRRNEASARRIERELGLPPPRPVAVEKAVGDRQKTDAASRRSSRKHLTKGETQMETSELSRLVFESVAAAKTTQEFDRELAARGIEVEWSANLSGLKLRPKGASTWLKGSSLNRELSAAKITAALARNADLSTDAERAAAVAVGTAHGRAAAVTAARLGKNESEAIDANQVAQVTAPRALPPPAAAAARALTTAAPDPLAFLVPAEPVPAELDDAPLVVVSLASQPQADPDEEAEMARARAAVENRNEADEELSRELRALNAKQLQELRNTSKRPLDDLVISAALIEKLLALAARILSFGMWKKSTPMADALASRQRVAKAADDEITRRHRTPNTVTDRLKFLKEHKAALNSRRIQLDARQTMIDLSKHQPAPKHPRVTELKNKLAQHQAQAKKINSEEPSRVSRLMKTAVFLAWQKRLARAEELRDMTRQQVDDLMREIQESAAAREDANAAAVDATNKILADEAEAIKIEIRDRVPALQRQLDKDELQARLRQVDPDAEVNRG